MSGICSVKVCPSSRNKSQNCIFFTFPSEDGELLKSWLDKVDLQSELSSVSKICSLHFEDSCFVQDSEGDRKLLPNSVPLEFKENGAKHLNTKMNNSKNEQNQDIKPNLWNIPLNTSDKISQFEDFINKISSPEEHETWKENWKVFKQPDGVCFYRLSRDWNFSNVTISYKILVNKQLKVLMYNKDDEADAKELNWVLKSSTLELWSQFYNMLDYYQVEPHIQHKSNASHHLRQALKSLNKIGSSRVIDEQVENIKHQVLSTLNKANKTSNIDFVEIKQEIEDDFEFDAMSGSTSKLHDDMETNRVEEITFTATMKEESDEYEMEDEYCDDIDDPDFVVGNEATNDAESAEETSSREATTNTKTKRPRRKIMPDENGLFKCQLCDKSFLLKSQVKNHFWRAHDGPYFCDKCGKKCKNRASLNGHVARHEAVELVKCPQCDQMLQPVSLDRHIKVRHEGYKPFPCSICGKLFSSRTLVKEHEKIHVKDERFSSIDKEFEMKNGRFQCPKCNNEYERSGKFFRNHVAKCQGIPTEKKRKHLYPCPECDKKCVTKIACADHMAKKHNKYIENLYKYCFECKAEFDDPMHSRIHGCEFQCPMCGFRFNSQQKLDKHVEEKHESDEVRPFACDLCPLSFKTSNHLRSHKASIHMSADEKKFVCEICSRRYTFQFMLTTHIKQSHSEVKRFGCSYCGMKFSQLHTMKQHYKVAHGEEFTYPCPDCPEKMKTLNDLKRHRQDLHGK